MKKPKTKRQKRQKTKALPIAPRGTDDGVRWQAEVALARGERKRRRTKREHYRGTLTAKGSTWTKEVHRFRVRYEGGEPATLRDEQALEAMDDRLAEYADANPPWTVWVNLLFIDAHGERRVAGSRVSTSAAARGYLASRPAQRYDLDSLGTYTVTYEIVAVRERGYAEAAPLAPESKPGRVRLRGVAVGQPKGMRAPVGKPGKKNVGLRRRPAKSQPRKSRASGARKDGGRRR
jgi:hypothetical protein